MNSQKPNQLTIHIDRELIPHWVQVKGLETTRNLACSKKVRELNGQAKLAADLGFYHQAITLLSASLAYSETNNQIILVLAALNNLAVVYYQQEAQKKLMIVIKRLYTIQRNYASDYDTEITLIRDNLNTLFAQKKASNESLVRFATIIEVSPPIAFYSY